MAAASAAARPESDDAGRGGDGGSESLRPRRPRITRKTPPKAGMSGLEISPVGRGSVSATIASPIRNDRNRERASMTALSREDKRHDAPARVTATTTP